METTFLLISGVLVGLVLGSFTTMLTYRLPRRLSIVLPPSQCPQCKHRLTVRDLFPVFSWVFNGGKCRHCGAKIGARYLKIEIITTLAVTAAFLVMGVTLALIFALIAIVSSITLITIIIENNHHRRSPS